MKKSELKQHINESEKRLKKYDSVLNEAERTFRELNSQNMQATLIQIEDFFDSNNLYAFNNWFEGIVWDGPNVSRHWVEITLKYPYLLMPEPRAMRRFLEMGVKFDFSEEVMNTPMKVKGPDDLDPVTRKPKEKEEKIWLVDLKIPRHLIDDPLPDETEEPDTVQNIEASDKSAADEDTTGGELDLGDLGGEDTGGDSGDEDLAL